MFLGHCPRPNASASLVPRPDYKWFIDYTVYGSTRETSTESTLFLPRALSILRTGSMSPSYFSRVRSEKQVQRKVRRYGVTV